jgi:3-oxoacyl-[acyl-carrier protein] reductase
MAESLKGKVAIVTGSGQGIGKGIAVYLARQGVKVITNNRKPGSSFLRTYKKEDMPEEDWVLMNQLAGDAESAADLIRSEGGEAAPFYGDMSDYGVAERAVKFAVDTYGSIDILINNAAGTGSGGVVELTKEKWDYLSKMRLDAAFNLMHFAVPHMINRGGGRIINASSEAWLGMPFNDGYTASTAGAVGLTWASAKELWRFGITVNCFCPQGASPAHAVEYNALMRNIEKTRGKRPDPEILKVVEENHGDSIGIGPVIAFLCSQEASYISGNVFSIYASGVVKLFSEPAVISQISRPSNDLWTLDELKVAFREQLLGKDYIAPGSKSNLG